MLNLWEQCLSDEGMTYEVNDKDWPHKSTGTWELETTEKPSMDRLLDLP